MNPLLAFDKNFFSELADVKAIMAIFEFLPGVFFFVKDRQSRLLYGSANLRERLGLNSEADLTGRPDYDFFPSEVADSFRGDDENVFRTGKPLINRLEVWLDEQRNPSWFLTTKLPLLGKTGSVIGLIGITRPEEHSNVFNSREIRQVIDHLEQNTEEAFSISKLSGEFGMSPRTFYRKIKESTGLTPNELTLRIRIQRAGEALVRTSEKVAEISRLHGFCTQSHFIQVFKRRTGLTPKQFRVRYQA